MNNAAPQIRKAFKALVSGLSYNGSPLPCYDSEGKAGEPMQVIITEINRADRGTKHSFRGTYTVLLEVCAEQTTAYRKDVDEVGGLIMDAVSPTPRDHGLEFTGFQAVSVSLIGQNYIDETIDAGTVAVRLFLRYQLQIVEA